MRRAISRRSVCENATEDADGEGGGGEETGSQFKRRQARSFLLHNRSSEEDIVQGGQYPD